MTDRLIVKVQTISCSGGKSNGESYSNSTTVTRVYLASDITRYDHEKGHPHLNFWVMGDNGEKTLHQAVVNGGDGESPTTEYHINATAAWVETLGGARIESLRPKPSVSSGPVDIAA